MSVLSPYLWRVGATLCDHGCLLDQAGRDVIRFLGLSWRSTLRILSHNLGSIISLLLLIVLAHIFHGFGFRNSFGDDLVGLAVRNKIDRVFIVNLS